MSLERQNGDVLFVILLTGVVVLSGLAVVDSFALDQQESAAQAPSDRTERNNRLDFATTNTTIPLRGATKNPANTNHLNTTGPTEPITLRWKFPMDNDGITGVLASNGAIYFGAKYRTGDDRKKPGKVYAVDALTGAERWNVTFDGDENPGSLTVFRDTLYVSTSQGRLFALNATTGEIFWTKDDPVGGGPVINRTIYTEEDCTVYALSALTGDKQWSFNMKAPRWAGCGGPAVGDGSVYARAYQYQDNKVHARKVYALDAETGDVQWTSNTPEGKLRSPVVANGHVYVGGRHGHVYAMEAETGAERWHRHFQDSKGTKSPTVVGDTAYISTAGDGLYAVDAMTGETRWHIDSPNSKPVVANDTAYVRTGAIKPQGESTRSVYALDAETGAELTRFTLGDPDAHTITGPTVLDGSLYIGYGISEQGTGYHVDRTALYALGTPEFTYSNLSVTSRSVEINESVTVTATVTNTGTGPGAYNATMVVNGAIVDATTGQLDAGTSTTVEFTGTFSENGTYTVGIAGLKRTIGVGDIAPPPTPTPTGAATQTASSPSGPSPTKPATTPTTTTTPGFGVAVFVVTLAVLVAVIVGRRRG